MPPSPRNASLLLIGPSREFPQERARGTYEGLVAAARLFAERCFDATQTPDIAAAAGVSVGTSYRYFDDKLDIFLEVERRYLALTYKEVMARLTPDRFVSKNNRAVIDDALGVLVEHINRSPSLQRAFLEMALRDLRVAALKPAFDDASRKTLAALIVSICSLDQVSDPEATATVMHTAVLECAFVISGVRGPLSISCERAMAALSTMVYRAVFGHEG